MFFRLTLLLALFCCCGASAHAQDVAAAPVEAPAPDPYTQSYSMGLYLSNNISTPQLQNFLHRVRESGDFNVSFQAEFGLPVEQFYQVWKADSTRRFAAR